MAPRQSQQHHDVTALVASIAMLEERLGNLIDEFRREREGASLDRRRQTETISALSESVRALNQTMKVITPIVEDYQHRSIEARGIFKLGKIIHALTIMAAAAFGVLVAKYVK